ncbi:MAG: RluA family pseudouridine synthase [Verrucomicrobiota bacterium]|nr:RluA family pseudouridine synthase [Verrucomicrobiota bacterium]
MTAVFTNASYQLIAERPEFLVVSKPSHLLVHPTKPSPVTTLIDLLRLDYPNEPLSLVNRLDRETSGLIIVARSKEASGKMGKKLMRREVTKEYHALVYGHGTLPEQGEIDAPLGRLGEVGETNIYLRQSVLPLQEGKKIYPARTSYKILKTFTRSDSDKTFHLVQLQAHTGRLHQVRVHMSYIGFPLVGDKIYGPDSNHYLTFIRENMSEALRKDLLMDRHALHASRLNFEWDGELLTFESPLPADMCLFMESHVIVDSSS